ncbi:hypothetical protein SLE2022_370420 [Rubroshorea leprosula]
MAKPIQISFLLLSCFVLTTTATTYIIGDTSGWDISTNLDSWAADKTFKVGDVLVFQDLSSDNICEVTKENFRACNTTNVISRYSNRNTTISLTQPGMRYFIDGNQMYCLGGLKLQVNVEGDTASSPIGAPQAQPGATQVQPGANLPTPNSKSGNPVSTSDGGIMWRGWESLAVVLVGVVVTVWHFV